MAEDTMLAEAVSAAKAGETARARDLLARLLRADSSNPDYWLWMSSVVESERESVYCLRSVTKMRPGHPWARLGLTALGQISLASERAAPAKQHRAIPFPHQAAGSINSMADWWKIRRNRDNAMIFFLGAILSVLILFVIAGSVEYAIPVAQGLAGTPTDKAASPTPAAKPTMGIGNLALTMTSMPSSGLVPLATYVNAGSTVTPLYGVTPSTAAFDLGMVAFVAGKYQDALTQFQTAEGLSPTDPQIAYYLGETLRHLNRMQESLEKYNRAVQLNPQYAMGYFGLAMWHKQDNPGSAYVNDLSKALEYDPELIDAYIERANYYSFWQGDWSKARADLEVAVSINSNHALALVRLGRAQVHTDQLSAALVNLLHAQLIDPTILEGYLGIGEAYYALGLYSLGAASLATYTTYAPDDINGWILLCQINAGAGDLENAVTAGTKAVELDTNSINARWARGDAYRLAGQYALAASDFKVSYERAPMRFNSVFGYGRALVLANNPIDAVGILNEARAKAETKQIVVTPAQMADIIGWDAIAYEKKGEPDHAKVLWNDLFNLAGVPDSWKVEAYKHILGLANTPAASGTKPPSKTATPSPGSPAGATGEAATESPTPT
jgi:tetratricopeptide (TPR) repeat protein